LSQAADILRKHSMVIADFNKSKLDVSTTDGFANAAIPPQTYDTPIEDLNLSVRTYNCLKRSNITKVGQILQMDEKDLLSVRNFGRKSYDELRASLISHGFMSSANPIGPFAGTSAGVSPFDDEDAVSPSIQVDIGPGEDSADEE